MISVLAPYIVFISALHEAPFPHAFSNSPPNPILESGKLQSPSWSAMIPIRTPEVFVWGKNLLKILHGCVFFPFFQAQSCSSVEKVDTWFFSFVSALLDLHKSFFSLIYCLAKKFLCICHPLSAHKFSDCSLQERDRCPEEIMRTTYCDVNR